MVSQWKTTEDYKKPENSTYARKYRNQYFGIHPLTLQRMQHKGEIIEKAVRDSGYPITKLAKKMGKSRRWVYQIFESQNVPVDYVMEIGRIIYHDFAEEMKDLNAYKNSLDNSRVSEVPGSFRSDHHEAEYWKNKYLYVLERYNELLVKQKGQ